MEAYVASVSELQLMKQGAELYLKATESIQAFFGSV